MAADANGLRDSFAVELNPAAPVVGSDIPPVDPRPLVDAGRPAWVDYCVLLGAHRGFLESATGLDLIELAERLGG